MGKKKIPMKTKEVSVAISESSSVIGDVQVEQQLVQHIIARKRGRPRKIVEKSEEEEEDDEEEIVEEKRHEDLLEEMESKNTKSNEELVKEEAKEISSPTTCANKDLPARRSRRKSRPRKSC